MKFITKSKTDNKIHQQIGGTCTGFAAINAYEHVTGVDIPVQDLYDIFKEYDTDGREGMDSNTFLSVLSTRKYEGWVLDSFEEIYHVYKKKLHKQFWKDINEAVFRNDQALIFNIRIRAGRKNLPLDDEGALLPNTKAKIKGFHSVYCLGKWMTKAPRKLKGFEIENSWGEKWGKNGLFYLRTENFYTEVHDAYLLKFKNIHNDKQTSSKNSGA